LSKKPRYYWDACMWIALIKREEPHFEACKHVIERAQKGEVEICTSAFTYAEVFKRRCNETNVGISADNDENFEDYLTQNHIIIIQVDVDIGIAARRLLRQFPKIGKPQDAIHLASALIENVDELHTFDREDLLGLNNKIPCANGVNLKICHPQNPPDPNEGSLFKILDKPDQMLNKKQN
jgi:predicted nucleic acid-binding protein